jgi:hypothetical protein
MTRLDLTHLGLAADAAASSAARRAERRSSAPETGAPRWAAALVHALRRAGGVLAVSCGVLAAAGSAHAQGRPAPADAGVVRDGGAPGAERAPSGARPGGAVHGEHGRWRGEGHGPDRGPLSPEQRAERVSRRVERLAARLGLDARQKEQAERILRESIERAEQARAERRRALASGAASPAAAPPGAPQAPPREAWHAQRRLHLEETARRLEAILTPAQRTQWATLRAEMEQRFASRGHHGHGGGHGCGRDGAPGAGPPPGVQAPAPGGPSRPASPAGAPPGAPQSPRGPAR